MQVDRLLGDHPFVFEHDGADRCLPPPIGHLLPGCPASRERTATGLRLDQAERTAEIRQLEARSVPPRFTACAHLILDMLNSNPMLFIRGDEAEEAWRIIDPVMNAWAAGDVLMQEYPAGQAPPGPPS
jgi:glucose-6-phosphate 1-dehydrogenase